MTKSLKKAYLLWCVGGLFGLHHVYLGRDKQALIWSMTFGGFLIGLLRDLYRMPTYVNEANQDEEYMSRLKLKQSRLKTPGFLISRFIACILVGAYFGYAAKYCLYSIDLDEDSPDVDLDEWYISLLKKLLAPVVVGIIVYLIGTEGPYKCQLKWPLLGSLIAFLADIYRNSNSNYSSPILATMFLNWNIEWESDDYFEKKQNKKLYKRIAYLSIGVILFSSMFGLFIWNNTSFTVDGKKVTLKEAVHNFINSKELKELKNILNTIWNFYKAHGFKKLLNNFYYGYDADAVSNAYKVKPFFNKFNSI